MKKKIIKILSATLLLSFACVPSLRCDPIDDKINEIDQQIMQINATMDAKVNEFKSKYQDYGSKSRYAIEMNNLNAKIRKLKTEKKALQTQKK